MSAAFPSPGDTIGRFRVLSQLGAGGMGVVYDALETNLDRRVALKVISPVYAADPDFRGRFTREARALASLDSPHVVQVYAHGEEDGHLYIATQLVPDGDLGQMIHRWGPAPHGRAAELIEQVASGLADAHAAGLVHRDIKPANVLVRRRGATTVHAYLGDFGIARRLDAEATRVGTAAVGTPSFMAPELHSGATAGVASDLYSLGCLLWVALTGQAPYAGTTDYEVVSAHLNRPVPQLAGGTPVVTALNRVLQRAMAKDPAQRHPSATALRDDLREVARLVDDPAYLQPAVPLGGSVPRTPTPPAPPPPLPPTPLPPTYVPAYAPAHHSPPARSRRGLWIAVAAVVAVLAVGGGTAAALLAGGDDETSAGEDRTDGPTGTETQSETETETETEQTTTQTSEPAFADGDPADIVAAAETEMKSLESVRIAGTVESDGQPGSFDLTISTRGDCEGEISVGQGSTEIRRVDEVAYLRPDRAFLEASAGLDGELLDTFVTQVDGRWIRGEAGDTDFEELCNLATLLEDDGGPDGTYTTGELSEINGRTVVAITETGGSDGDSTAYIDVDDPHYLVRLEAESDDGTFTFTRFDEEFTVEAPPAAETFSF